MIEISGCFKRLKHREIKIAFAVFMPIRYGMGFLFAKTGKEL